MHGEHGFGAFDRAQTASQLDLGAVRLGGEGDDLAGKEDAERRGADQHFILAAAHPHVVLRIVAQAVGHGAAKGRAAHWTTLPPAPLPKAVGDRGSPLHGSKCWLRPLGTARRGALMLRQ